MYSGMLGCSSEGFCYYSSARQILFSTLLSSNTLGNDLIDSFSEACLNKPGPVFESNIFDFGLHPAMREIGDSASGGSIVAPGLSRKYVKTN